MSYSGNLGFITAITSVVSQGISTGGSLAAQKAALSQQEKLDRARSASTERIMSQNLDFKREELARQTQIATERNKLFTKLFIYSAVGLGLVGLLITTGVLAIQAKGK